MRIGRWSLPGLILLAALPGGSAALEITETRFEGRPHFRVGTERATWLYDRAGGGFSRLVDREGRDWIGFGRGPETTPQLRGAGHRFIVGLLEADASDPGAHEDLAARIEAATEDQSAGSMLVVPHNTDVTIHEIPVVPVEAPPAGGE